METKKRKTVIPAKTRLLLEIALCGVEDTPDYLAGLSKRIEDSPGSIKSEFLPDLLSAGFIKSFEFRCA